MSAAVPRAPGPPPTHRPATTHARAQVGSEFGIDMHKDDLDGLTKIYGQYLEALIPSGDQQLRCALAGAQRKPREGTLRRSAWWRRQDKVVGPRVRGACRGDEAPKIIAFKQALGLVDEEAAPVHVEVARRLFRQVR